MLGMHRGGGGHTHNSLTLYLMPGQRRATQLVNINIESKLSPNRRRYCLSGSNSPEAYQICLAANLFIVSDGN